MIPYGGKRTEKAAKIQIKNYMLLVSRQNLDYRRYWIHYFLTLTVHFTKRDKLHLWSSLVIFYIYFSKYYLCENYSKTENSPNAKVKKNGGGVKLKSVYMKVILEMFLNLQFLQNN